MATSPAGEADAGGGVGNEPRDEDTGDLPVHAGAATAAVETRPLSAPGRAEAAAPLLVLRGLRIERGRLDDVFTLEIEDLRIPRGAFVAILGGSGIGKTTLLTVLGLLRGPRDDPDFRMRCEEMSFHLPGDDPGTPDRVEVVYRGLDGDKAETEMPQAVRELLRREKIGFCLQGGELLPALSLVDNCAAPAELCGLDRPLERSARVLTQLGMVAGQIGNQLGRLPGSLSGGQRQRGVLARALVHDPALVVLDEPTTGLDRGTAREAVALLHRRARAQGQTVVMVTHDRHLADEFADLVVEMDVLGKRRSGITRIRSRPAEASPPEAPALAAGLPRTLPTTRVGRKRFGYYVRLGLFDALGPVAGRIGDSFRRTVPEWRRFPGWKRQVRWSFPLQIVKNAAIVVAVGLLVLLMRGMRSGQVQELHDRLAKSPTARELVLTPRTTRTTLSRWALDQLPRVRSEIELIIPKFNPIIASTSDREDSASAIDVELSATAPNDPSLLMIDEKQSFAGLDANAIVLPTSIAARLGVKQGDSLRLWFSRWVDHVGGRQERSDALLRVSNVVDTPKATAYVHVDLARDVSDYKAGRRVASRGWPSRSRDVTARFRAFLAFCKRELGSSERQRLKNVSLVATRVAPEDPVATLYGLLRPPEDEGFVYLLAPHNVSEEETGGMILGSDQIADVENAITGVEGVLLPWNVPLAGDVAGLGRVLLVGVSCRWLRWVDKRVTLPAAVFPEDFADWQAIPLLAGSGAEGRRLHVEGLGRAFDLNVDVTRERVPTATPVGGPASDKRSTVRTLFVPADFLSRLYLSLRGEAEPDLERSKFLTGKEEERYQQARIFVKDIDQVLDLHRALELENKFLVSSSQERVREIQGYAAALGRLTSVVSVLAAIAALLTVGVVFHEIAESKKRMMATLRVMGLSRVGAQALLMTRGVLVAAVAAVLVVILGLCISLALRAARPGLCVLSPVDYGVVALGIGAVCLLGTWWPARSVSHVDPVLALQQAEER